jgi:hypothetical protein
MSSVDSNGSVERGLALSPGGLDSKVCVEGTTLGSSKPFRGARVPPRTINLRKAKDHRKFFL